MTAVHAQPSNLLAAPIANVRPLRTVGRFAFLFVFRCFERLWITPLAESRNLCYLPLDVPCPERIIKDIELSRCAAVVWFPSGPEH